MSIPKPVGYYKTTVPDGTVKLVTPKECASAWVLASLSEELADMCRLVSTLEIGDEVDITGIVGGKECVMNWKRIR